MKVKELIDHLKAMDPDKDVCFTFAVCQYSTKFVESVKEYMNAVELVSEDDLITQKGKGEG